ncbi:MAG TPA: sugar ABC transporter ATP-binding protein [Vicinamibacteria bacterium]|nr:sugar ABC transporter ATP-binding protein [Vicinamibacteria bacterium]
MAEAVAALPPRLEMRGVSKAFGATVALDGVDLTAAGGEVVALVGQNGAGKSTLMAVLSGAVAPDAGTMALDGRPYAPRDPLQARRAGVAMIYQELSVAPHLTVAENVVLGAEPGRLGMVDQARARRLTRDVFARLGHPDVDPDARVGGLSVAHQQLVEIARAFATGARVLVLDEPTSSLGREDARRLFELVRRLRADGQAVVYISHFIEEVKEVADRYVVLRDGRNAGGGPTAGATREEIVSLMVGRRVEDLFPRTPRRRGEPLLEVEGVLSGGAGFTLHRGEVLGIAGLVGAGRTRLLRTIFGLEPVRGGRIRLGAFSGAAGPPERWEQGMGLLSEDRKGEGLALGLAVADNLALSRLEGLGPGPLVFPSRLARAARRWIQDLGIRTAGPGQAARELSGGNQQKVALARLLHHDVDVLLLDEPTRGIDVASKAQIYALVDGLVAPEERQEAGRAPRAVLVASSDLAELLGLCDRIAVMCRGRLGPPRPASEWDEHALMMAATGTLDAA